MIVDTYDLYILIEYEQKLSCAFVKQLKQSTGRTSRGHHLIELKEHIADVIRQRDFFILEIYLLSADTPMTGHGYDPQYL